MVSLGPAGKLALAAQMAGYTYESMVNHLLDLAVTRYFGA